MISRRILRVKVMQVLFAEAMDPGGSAVKLESTLSQKISKTEQLYFVYLQYLIEICQYVLIDEAKRANRFIKTEKDLNINTDLARNSLVSLIHEQDLFKFMQEKHSSKGFIDNKIVKDLFNKLCTTEKYVKYCEIDKKSKADEVEILRYISKKIIGASEMLDENLAEHFMSLEDDHFVTLHSIQKKFKEYSSDSEVGFIKSILLESEDDEAIVFSKQLLNSYLENIETINTIIKPRLKNWDMDRVALIDLILLKLALCEFLYFPYIPLKVSLNEYIDISKEYSTNKSKDFINGVLDKAMKILKEEGKIKKLGRGLINN